MKIDMMNQGAGNEAIAHENATTTNALKATRYKSHPVVCYAAGFIARAGSKAGGVGYKMERCPTLKAELTTEVVYCIQGNCIDRADTARCNGKGVRVGQSYTLNTIDRHAVAYKKEETG